MKILKIYKEILDNPAYELPESPLLPKEIYNEFKKHWNVIRKPKFTAYLQKICI
jgi:hypothetical protein